MEESTISEREIKKHLGAIDATQLEMNTAKKTRDDELDTCVQEYDASCTEYYSSLKELFRKRDEHIKNIPEFWVTCLKNHPEFQFMIGGETEMECLNFLEKIEVDELGGYGDYQIKFHFMENPFFKNKVIIKTVDAEGRTPADASDAKSTVIQWKKGKNLATDPRRKQKFLRFQSWRPIMFPVQDTLFSWLADESTLPSLYAYYLKEHIWLDPVKYFSGELSDDEDDGKMSIEDEEEDSADGN